MKIALRIEYREGVEDPEASTVSKNCEVLGFQDLSKIKIAKEYVFDVNESNPEKRVEEPARDNEQVPDPGYPASYNI